MQSVTLAGKCLNQNSHVIKIHAERLHHDLVSVSVLRSPVPHTAQGQGLHGAIPDELRELLLVCWFVSSITQLLTGFPENLNGV